jgi:protein transport protein SEC61 subunit gamma-like protein
MAKNERSSITKSNKQEKLDKQDKTENPSIWHKIERRLREYQRILTLTRRPSRDEFSTIAKVAAIGIIVIGFAGFAIYLGMVIVPQNLGIKNATISTQNVTAPSENKTLQVMTNTTVKATPSNVTGLVEGP